MDVRLFKSRLWLILILFVLFFSIGVNAGAAQSDLDESKLEAITVTAEKRREDVQKITSSVTVLLDTVIEDSGIESTRDIKGYVPNLSTANGGSRGYFSRMSVRGISNGTFGDPSVALYIDDIAYSDLYIFNSPIYDAQRVEILKGPQGTLYGKNTEGGAINIITKEPDNNTEYKIKLSSGDYNKTYFNASMNSPIIEDKLFSRFSVLMSSRDGYVKNLYNGEDIGGEKTLGARGRLLYRPTERLGIDFILETSKMDDKNGFPMVATDKAKYKKATGLDVDDFETAFDHSGKSECENILSAFKVKYEFDSFDFLSVSGFRNNDNKLTLDGDFLPMDGAVGFNERTTKAYTQEIRISSKEKNQSSKWLMGLFYGDEEVDQSTGYMMGKAYAGYYGVPVGTKDDMSAVIDKEDAAVFGQGSKRFFSDIFGVTAGVRYEKSKRTMDRTHTFGGVNSAKPMKNLENDYSQVLPKVSLDYKISEDVMLYTSYAKGYKSGGFSYATDNPELTEFDPEVSNAYEIGLKTEFKELGLRFNIAGFYTDVDDYQDRVGLSPTDVLQVNAAEVKIYGFEIESKYALTSTLTLSAMFGYTNAKYKDYIDPASKEDYEDNDVCLIPEFDSGIFLDYRNPEGLMARFEIQKIGESYLNRQNDLKQDGYTLYNAKFGYETETWDLYFSMKNITNEQYFLDACDTGAPGYMATVGDPRTIDLTMNLRF